MGNLRQKTYELEARKLLTEVSEKLFCLWVAETTNISWYNRKRFFGEAQWKGWFSRQSINLSIHWWPKLTLEQKRELITHEFCHVVAQMCGQYSCHHRGTWAELMKSLGYKPRATYDW